jgi:hypothetical protein
MAQINDRLDRLVLEARRGAETREQGYRAQALKLFPWVCGRCARTFDHANLQLLEVHHKNNNHRDKPMGIAVFGRLRNRPKALLTVSP